MRRIPYGKKQKRGKVIGGIIIILVPVLFSGYMGSCISSLNAFADELNRSEIDYGSLIPANYSRMAEMVNEMEFYMMRDNLPLNYTLTAYWNQNFTEINAYGVSGDAAIWTGMTLAMASFRYAAKKQNGNQTEIDESLAFIKRMIHGVSLLLAVPNGGIGPSYPGVLARSVSPKNWTDSNPPIYHYDYSTGADDIDVFDGVGEYEDWLWIGYPSLDQYSGIIMGISVTSALVNDNWVQGRMRLLSSQIIEHFRKTDWYLTDGNDRTTGQTFKWKPEHSSFWVLSTIFMGVLSDPAKYQSLYHHWAYDRGYADSLLLSNDLRFFSLFNYFSLNINWVILYPLATFETNPYLRSVYTKLVREQMYPAVKNHRNAWFNIAYLHIMGINDSKIQSDIEDQIMRFDIERITGDPNSTRIPERGLNNTGNRYENLVPESWPEKKFSNWLEGQLLYPNKDFNLATVFLEEDRYLAKPKTVEYYQSVDFLWQRTPWVEYNYSPAIRQDSGLSLLLPYYMGRYHGSILGG